jgi:hypothetical protein
MPMCEATAAREGNLNKKSKGEKYTRLAIFLGKV